VAVVVVKVGGSLYDWPELGPRLRWFLASLREIPLLVPGGGPAADAVAALDRTHQLGEGATHWLALRACAVNAHFLAALLGGAPVVADAEQGHLAVLNPFAFARADEGRPGALPHHHDATTDSVAARAAVVAHAPLVLLKSADLPAGDWDAAAAAGQVDPLFPGIVRAAGLAVRAVNLRAWGGNV
jgi:aspartokinase-like uncharacterized kinase